MRLTSALDTLLDVTVVPGFSRIGYSARRRWWPADPPAGALTGRVVAVTGANSGLGRATAVGAARLGARVRMLCRSVDRGEAARAEILAAVPGADVTVDRCDLSDLGSVRETAAALAGQLPALHALVHNAGVLPPAREETADGHELTFATHVLGPHLLTAALRPLLAADGDARVVWVSSGGMYTQRLRLDDPEFRLGEYNGTTAYARTKRMQVVLAQRWARELAGERVAVHSMHPGWADTPGVQDSLPGFSRLTAPILRTAEQGADTVVWLLAAPPSEAPGGLFWHDRRPRPIAYLPGTRHTPEQAEQLWRLCVTATGAPVAQRR